jgi:hypothetical protein
MYRYVAFLDSVLDQIEEHIARFPPERGGALLGPVGQPLVTEFIFDPEAVTSGMTYTPSRWLADKVRARESADPQIEFKGMLHSHPGDMSWPSKGDHHAYEDSLEGAPWLGRLVAPIVTVGTRLRREHEVPLPSGTMSVYIAERRPDSPGGVAVEPAEPHVLKISQDLKSLAGALGGTAESPFITDIEGQTYVAGVVGCEGFDLQVLVGPAYPFTPPVVIAARRPEAKENLVEPRLGLHWNGNTPASQALRLAWDLEAPDETRLLAALLTAGQAPHSPDAPHAALVAGQAALTAAQAALTAGQAALAAGQAALAAKATVPAAGLPEPDAELAGPAAEVAALAARATEPAADLAEPDADLAGPAAEVADSEAEVPDSEAEPGPEEAEAEAEQTEPDAVLVAVAVEVPEPDAGQAPDTAQDSADDEQGSPHSPGWHVRLLQRIMRVLNPRRWRRQPAAPPIAVPDNAAEPVQDGAGETVAGDDSGSIQDDASGAVADADPGSGRDADLETVAGGDDEAVAGGDAGAVPERDLATIQGTGQADD